MKSTDISDQELLEIIRKSIDLDSIAAKDPRATRKRLEELFGRLKTAVEGRPPGVQAIHRATKGQVRHILVYTDGASRGNPGKAGVGVVICDKERHVLEEVSEYIGETTNNVAEYKALIRALEKALEYCPKELEIFSDSELLVRQVNGQYKVRAPSILPLYNKAKKLMEMFPRWTIEYIPRGKNALADTLANTAIDTHSN